MPTDLYSKVEAKMNKNLRIQKTGLVLILAGCWFQPILILQQVLNSTLKALASAL